MAMDLVKVAGEVLDEAGFAENAGGSVLPPDLVIHDRQYHRGNYRGGKCKYREDRAKALEGRQESEWKDIIDRLTPDDVDGEEKDKADELPEAPVASLEAALPKMKGVAAKALGALIEKRRPKGVQPLLDRMAEVIGGNADSDGENNPAFGDAMRRLSALVKSGALNEMLGLGKAPGGVAAPGKVEAEAKAAVDPARARELNERKANLEHDAAMIRDRMSLATPRLAAILQSKLGEIDKEIGGIDDELAGKPGNGKGKDDKTVSREAQKKATKEFQEAVRKSSAPMGLSKNPVDGETVAMDSADFKAAFGALPADRRIYAFSDMHDTEWKKMGMSKCGTVMISGDINDSLYSSPKDHEDEQTQIARAQEWIDREFAPFCAKHPNQRFVMCPGNHDNVLALPGASGLKWPSNVTLLNDAEANVNGMRVYGTGICGRRAGYPDSYFVGRPFELGDDDYRKRADAIPEGLDVLLVHHPPKESGYEGDKTMVNGKVENSGMAYLADVIRRKKPKLVICGHLHDGDHRPYKIGDSVVINAARVSNWGRKKGSYSHHDIGMVGGAGNVGFFVDGEDTHIGQ